MKILPQSACGTNGVKTLFCREWKPSHRKTIADLWVSRFKSTTGLWGTQPLCGIPFSIANQGRLGPHRFDLR